MAILKVDLPIFTGLTLTLWVYQDGVLINTGGDSLTEIGNGHFQATVAESLSGTYTAQIQNASGQVIAYGDVDSTGLYVGRLDSDRGVVVYPIQSTTVTRVAGTTLVAYVGESVEFTILPVDSVGNSIDTTGMTLEVTIENTARTELQTIADGSITKTTTSFAFTASTANAAAFSGGCWACRRTDTDEVIAYGQYNVYHAPGA
jgi:hypothetical protein